MQDYLAQIDRSLFYWINHGHQNGVFDELMPFLSDDGAVKPIFAVVWLCLLVFGNAHTRWAAILVVPLVALSDQTSSHFLKEAFERIRPCNVLPEVHLLVGCSSSFSMPSSHAANSGAAAFHFMLFFPQPWSLLFGLLALGVSYSRVYCGVHYPADVLVGLLVGLATALAIQGLYRVVRTWRARTRAVGRGADPRPRS